MPEKPKGKFAEFIDKISFIELNRKFEEFNIPEDLREKIKEALRIKSGDSYVNSKQEELLEIFTLNKFPLGTTRTSYAQLVIEDIEKMHEEEVRKQEQRGGLSLPNEAEEGGGLSLKDDGGELTVTNDSED